IKSSNIQLYAHTSNHSRNINQINAEINTVHNKVETVFIATDKATLPLAKNVMTFEAVPPGQQPTRMTPSAISGGNASNFANANAKCGIMENYKTTPAITLFGCFKICLKFSKISVIPIQNIIIPSKIEIAGAIQIIAFGDINSINANNNTQAANVLPANLRTFVMNYITFPLLSKKPDAY